jgi:hypothetical protein
VSQRRATAAVLLSVFQRSLLSLLLPSPVRRVSLLSNIYLSKCAAATFMLTAGDLNWMRASDGARSQAHFIVSSVLCIIPFCGARARAATEPRNFGLFIWECAFFADRSLARALSYIYALPMIPKNFSPGVYATPRRFYS